MPLALLDPGKDALFLDLDGTLIDIAPHPNAIAVPEALPSLLFMLWRRLGGALAIISGRSIADIDRLMSPYTLPAAGIHGAEMRLSVGGKIISEDACMPEPAREAVRLLSTQPGIIVEDKGLSLAVHYRSAAPEVAGLVRRSVEQLARLHGLTALEGKRVIELKASTSNKGIAVALLMRLPPFSGRRPVFVGDDLTDDDAFAVLGRFGGMGISVGTVRPHTAHVMETPGDVRSWLTALLDTWSTQKDS